MNVWMNAWMNEQMNTMKNTEFNDIKRSLERKLEWILQRFQFQLYGSMTLQMHKRENLGRIQKSSWEGQKGFAFVWALIKPGIVPLRILGSEPEVCSVPNSRIWIPPPSPPTWILPTPLPTTYKLLEIRRTFGVHCRFNEYDFRYVSPCMFSSV